MIALKTTNLSLVPSASATDISEELDTRELLKLKQEIDAFLEAQDMAEGAFCENDPACQDIQSIATEKALALKKRIRGLAIDCGIHADFLSEYKSTTALAVAMPF